MAAPFLRFPFPLKIGTDICQISRVYNILQSKSGARFVRRILAPEEQARPRWIEPVAWILGPEDARQAVAGEQRDQRLAVDGLARCRAQSGPVPDAQDRDPRIWKAAEFMAGRFAAKEATIKAHPSLRLTFHRIVVARAAPETAELHGADLHTSSGPPFVIVRGEDERAPAREALVSISHDGDYATAVCLGFEPGKHTSSGSGGNLPG